jgi:hypothetical protein
MMQLLNLESATSDFPYCASECVKCSTAGNMRPKTAINSSPEFTTADACSDEYKSVDITNIYSVTKKMFTKTRFCPHNYLIEYLVPVRMNKTTSKESTAKNQEHI